MPIPTKNWTAIPEMTTGAGVPAGGYVARITDVVDIAQKEYLDIVYDIAEGEYANHYSDDWGKQHPYAHKFVRSYKESATGMFSSFLHRLEDSNRNFRIAEWQAGGEDKHLDFIGKEIGLVLQKEQYTSNMDGSDKERIVVVNVISSQDVRDGNYTVPEPKDKRLKKEQDTSMVTDITNDIPF